MIIQNGLVFTEEDIFLPLTVSTDKDCIHTVSSPEESDSSPLSATSSENIFDASGCYVLPGLTDIHFHGCNGHDFCEGNEKAFASIATFALSKGVTSICPATMTLPEDELSRILRAAAHFSVSHTYGMADLIGIHMEGPFINPNKKGAQNAAFISSPCIFQLKKWQTDAQGLIKLVSLAPELTGAMDCIREGHSDFHFSIAHTEADYETALEAFANGADHVTHLYNAMPPFTHRQPGVIGAAFDSENCFAEIICDGIHCAPAAVRAAFRLFGKERMILISDSMEATGMPDGLYHLGGLDVTVNGNRATLSDGTLAGSVTPLYECMCTAVSMGIPLSAAVRAATINPCRSIGMDHLYGSILPGKKADFLILRQADLSIRAVIKNGESVCFA